MSKNRIKKNLNPITTRGQAENAMNELAHAENNKRKAIAERDTLILSITEDWAAKIEACEEIVDDRTAALHEWAGQHPELFEKKKSLDLYFGILGFRTGTPKLKLLKGWNWQKVTDAVLIHLPNFIRNAPEVDKENLIAQRAELSPAFPLCGIKVDQDESFFIEPNLTNLDAKQTVKS